MVHSGGSPRFTAFCTHAAAPGTAPEAPGAERGDLWVGAPGGALVRGAPRERCLRGTTGRLRAAGRHRGSLGLYRGCQCYFCWSLVLDMPGGAGDAFAGNRAYGIDLGCVLFAVWCGEKFRPVCFLLVSSRKFQQLTGQVWKHANKMLAGLAWEGDGVLELHSSLIQANSWCPYRHGDVNLMVSVLQWRITSDTHGHPIASNHIQDGQSREFSLGGVKKYCFAAHDASPSALGTDVISPLPIARMQPIAHSKWI